MKTYYIEKMDKPIFLWKKIKVENDNLKIYMNLNKSKNIKRIVERIKKLEGNNVVIDKELSENNNLINTLNARGIKIFDGRWLIKYLAIEILDFIVAKKGLAKQETEIGITTNEITDLNIETIKILAKQYKKVTVVTNHINKLRRIEREIYEKEGILLVITNNQKKSLNKAQIILNMDFNKEVLNRYQIYENAYIINLEGNMKIESKRFNGININDYEIETENTENIWRENIEKFKTKDLLEAKLYKRDTYKNIRKKLVQNNVYIKELYGLNGKM